MAENKTGRHTTEEDSLKTAGILCLGPLVMDITAAHLPERENWLEKQRIETIRPGVGGDAANQAVHLAALGNSAYLCACIGNDDNGRLLLSALKDRGVRTDFVRIKPDRQTGTALVLVDQAGERHTFSVKGAHASLCRDDIPDLRAGGFAALSLASLFSMAVLEADGLLEYLETARELGLPVFADLGSDKFKLGLEGIRRFLPFIDYFLPSLYDVLGMTGSGTAEEAAAFFLNEGVGTVMIKCGARGAYVRSGRNDGRSSCGAGKPAGDTSVWIPAAAADVVDTTGAGDCASAAFISRIMSGDDLESAARFACAAGSYSTQFVGASSFSLTEEAVRRMMD